MITIRVTAESPSWSFSVLPGKRYAARCGVVTAHDRCYRYAVVRAALRRLRVQHGSRPDDGASAAFPDGGYRLARWLAPDLRRGGPRLGGGGRPDRGGRRRPGGRGCVPRGCGGRGP